MGQIASSRSREAALETKERDTTEMMGGKVGRIRMVLNHVLCLVLIHESRTMTYLIFLANFCQDLVIFEL